MSKSLLISGFQKSRKTFSVELPWSKSISNRQAILWALSKHKIVPDFWSQAYDTQILLTQLKKRSSVSIEKIIDVADCGTALRFLTAFYAIGNEQVILTGTPRLKERPIGPLVDTLIRNGASIQYLEKIGYAPLSVCGPLNQHHLQIDALQSSQYASAILLILPFMGGGSLTLLNEGSALPYLDLTIDILKEAGIKIQKESKSIHVGKWEGNVVLMKARSDWSSVAYWLELLVFDVIESLYFPDLFFDKHQADSISKEIYSKYFGLNFKEDEKGIYITKSATALPRMEINAKNFPDLVPALALTGFGCGMNLKITGIENLAIKESNRIEAIAENLIHSGAQVTYNESQIEISGKPEKWQEPKKIQTFNDHRIAMAFAPLAAFGPLEIDKPQVVKKSYPNFWKELGELML